MNKNKQPTPEETARRLQNLVSQGMPDAKFSELSDKQPLSAMPEIISEDEKPDTKVEPVETVTKQSSPSQEEIQSSPQVIASVSATGKRKRREQPENFRDTYFRRIDFSDRQPLYITRATHERLTMITGIVGGRKATISSYVENILLQHLEYNREEINRLLDEHYTKNKNDFLNINI